MYGRAMGSSKPHLLATWYPIFFSFLVLLSMTLMSDFDVLASRPAHRSRGLHRFYPVQQLSRKEVSGTGQL